jgi:hypothetical protein
MTWESVGPESGIFQFPAIGDLVLVGFAEGDVSQAFVIRRLTSRADKIPLKAVDGDLVLKAGSAKKAWLVSGTKILIAKGDAEPTENLVLGKVLKKLLQDVLTAISTHTHTSGPPGVLTTPPTQAATFTGLKSDPVDNDKILSGIAFTEK